MFANLRLRRAIERGDLSAVQRALAAGADPESRSVQGYTPLMMAAEIGHTGILRALVIAGADPNRTVEISNPLTAGVTALMTACNRQNSTGRVEPVLALLELGADPEARDSLGRTALDYASISGYAEIAAALREFDER